MSAARPVTVLYTSSDASPQSGAFRWLVEMAVGIAERGYRPVLALPEEAATGWPPTAAPALRAYFLRLPRMSRARSAAGNLAALGWTILGALRIVGIIRREGVGVVHVNEIRDLHGGIAAQIARVPCVWHVRADTSTWPGPVRRGLPRLVAALADEVVCVSASVREEVFLRQGVRTGKLSVLHDAGPDPRILRSDDDRSRVRGELGARDGAPLVVLVSKLVEPKGHEVLLRAVPRILEAVPAARFAIVGGEEEGPRHRAYAERLRRIVQEEGVDGAVTFTGYRQDVVRLMAAADVLVHCPTHPDPFPAVVLEGMALGKPVVASAIGGVREQVEPGVSGVLVPPGDPVALADAIVSLLADPDRRRALGRAAASRVEATFRREAFFDRLVRIYERVGRS
jgi:glycosyltransferase involved in cell wall biosynthesis